MQQSDLMIVPKNGPSRFLLTIWVLLAGNCFQSLAQTPPPNDTCENARPLLNQQPFEGSTEGASNQIGPITIGCPVSVNCPLIGDAPGVWFTVLAGNNEQVAVTTQPRRFSNLANFDTKLYVFAGSCQALQCVACNDDGTDIPLLSSVVFTATGTPKIYYVYLTGYAPSDFGLYNLLVAKGQLPSNDSCENASKLSIGDSMAMSTYFGSTGIGTTEDSLDFCGLRPSFRVDPRVWFEISAEEGENVRVETGPVPGAAPEEFFEIIMFVYSGTCGDLTCTKYIADRENRFTDACISASHEFKSSGKDYVYVTGNRKKSNSKTECKNKDGSKGRFEISVVSPAVMPSPSSPSPPSLTPVECDSSVNPFCFLLELLRLIAIIFRGNE